MKSILDSVHGSIIVDTQYIKTIVDTPAFQRLRRIEQTAIRSIYPSARHDRFIHSLGVYHIGSLMVNHLKDELFQVMKDRNLDNYENYKKEEIDIICNSFLVACLLHDIAHAPFSHTFEEYYGSQTNLFKILNEELNGNLEGELDKIDNPNFHEYASAIAVVRIYGKKVIEDILKANLELVCRMIIGCFYVKEKNKYQLHNCFISLIHGDVVDADRMDYACRDVWASGYCTSSIDIKRIISALHIRRDKKQEELIVCFESKALNEINNMLDVRHFQNRYVINHHSVQYEQKLMVMAAEHAAYNIYKDVKAMQPITGSKALEKIICLDSCINSVMLPNNKTIKSISDEDILSLMKTDTDNTFYDEYASRQYNRIAVWKTPDEFYHFFPDVLRGVDLNNSKFEEKVSEKLKNEMGISDVIICKVKYKPTVNLKSLYIVVNDDVVRYTDIHPELTIDLSDTEKDINFYYLYVPFDKTMDWLKLREYRKKIVDCLSPLLKSLYTLTQQDVLYDKIQIMIDRSFVLNSKNDSEQNDNLRKKLNDYFINTGLNDFLNKILDLSK